MADNVEQIVLEADPGPAVQGAGEANAALDQFEKTGLRACAGVGKAMQGAGAEMIRFSDTTRNSAERAVASLERRLAALRSPIERLNTERAQVLDRLAGDPARLERARVAFEGLVAAQRKADFSSALERAQVASQKAAAGALQFDAALRKVNDTARQEAAAIEQSIKALERRAALAGKTGAQRIQVERQQFLGDLGAANPEQLARVNAAFTAMERAAGGAKTGVAGVVDSLKSAALQIGATYLSFEALKGIIQNVAADSAIFAARTETMGVALEAAGHSNDISVRELKRQEIALKGMGIATQEARQSLLRMVTAQIDVTKATQLGRLAQNAAVISLQNSSEAFEQLIYGIQSGQVRVLRTMGINVEFQESYEKLAKKIGKTTLELTDLEKVQARTNAVLEVAPRFAGLYEESMGSVGKQMTTLKRYFDEARNAVGDRFRPELQKVVDTLRDLLKLIQEHPELGTALTLGAAGGAAAVGAGALFGPKAGVAVGLGAAAYGTWRASRAAGEWIGEKYAQAWGFEGRQTLENQAALPGLAAKTRGEMMRDARAALMADVAKTGTLTREKRFDEQFSGHGEEYAKYQLSIAEKRVSNAIESKDDKALGAALQDRSRWQARLQAIQDIAANEKKIDDLIYKLAEQGANEFEKLLLEWDKEVNGVQKKGQPRPFTGAQLRAVNAAYGERLRQLGEAAITKAQTSESRPALRRPTPQELLFESTAQTFTQQQAAESYLGMTTGRTSLGRDEGYEAGRVAGLKQTTEAINESRMEADRRRLASLERELRLNEQLIQLRVGPGGELQAIEQSYQLRLRYAQQEYEINRRSIGDVLAGYKRQEQAEEAQIDRIRQIAELDRKRFDDLKSAASGLIDAAFTKSQSIGQAFGNMLKAMILTPVKEALAGVVAKILMPIMYGKDGRGGIMGSILGVFRQDPPLKISTDLNTGATDRNTVAIDNLTARLSGAPAGTSAGGGGSHWLAAAAGLGGLIAGGTRTVGGEVIGAGRVASAGLERLPSGLYNRAGVSAATDAAASSATAGTAGYASRGLQFGQVAQGAALLGGGMLAAQGLKRGGTSGNLMTIGGGAAMGYGAAGMMGMTGYGGAIAGAGAGLAMAGLQRGGWSGVGMSTAGGALVGLQFGGPIGAAIGAGVGFIAGLIRLGIKGATQKVIEKVEAAYHLKIDKGIAGQIVQIAKQNYGSNLDVAIRAPQVLELLQLYAMATGQQFGTQIKARTVSMVERSGTLYQNPLYENGSPLSYSGSLPVAGGVRTGIIPSNPNAPAAPFIPYNPFGNPDVFAGMPTTSGPGQSVQINLSLSPEQTLDVFSGKTIQVIQQNPRTVQAATYSATRANSGRRAMAAALLAPSELTS